MRRGDISKTWSNSYSCWFFRAVVVASCILTAHALGGANQQAHTLRAQPWWLRLPLLPSFPSYNSSTRKWENLQISMNTPIGPLHTGMGKKSIISRLHMPPLGDAAAAIPFFTCIVWGTSHETPDRAQRQLVLPMQRITKTRPSCYSKYLWPRRPDLSSF